MQKKLLKPVTKKMWSVLRFLPPILRKHILRSKFEICYSLSKDYVFKQADTEDEIEQAMSIVHEAYTQLGYIDDFPEQKYVNAFLYYPTTTILVIKFKNEVVGTMSIVQDSPLGLPSESTWDLSYLRNGASIGEVTSLAIKRSHKSSKGHLFLTLCKYMYEFGTQTLGLDGVVIAATHEVEPFYTDLLLFKKAVKNTGQKHMAVKGRKSTCCFVNFKKVKADYAHVYGKKSRAKNLHYFFTEFRSPNFESPHNTVVARIIKSMVLGKIASLYSGSMVCADIKRISAFITHECDQRDVINPNQKYDHSAQRSDRVTNESVA